MSEEDESENLLRPAPRKKICLFNDYGSNTPTVLEFKDLPLENWMDLASVVTAAERGAHMIELRQLRAALVAEDMYRRVVENLKNLCKVTGYCKYLRAKARQADATQRRRAARDMWCAAAHEEWLCHRPLAEIVLQKGIHVRPNGLCQPCSVPLAEDNLYLDAARPAMLVQVRLEHTCTLCLNAKSHPILYECKHSHCYVCICTSLETSWQCPQCQQPITARPRRDNDAAAEIAKDYPGWDNS
ncbi:hypothetical protein B0H13DRAFT_1869537 [Mycena leptocephala]|nr:hypothetical protein B0H13DRAFT_1869537 [Mycena leptocephala]